MKRLYVCGSFKFIREMKGLERKLREENIEYLISKKMDSRGILGCLKKIDDAMLFLLLTREATLARACPLT